MRRNSRSLRTLALWLGWLCCTLPVRSQAQSTDEPSPELKQVVRLSQADPKLGDDVIIKYVKDLKGPVRLTADDILYLNDQHVSPAVISALQAKTAAPAAPAAPPAAPLPAPGGPPVPPPQQQPPGPGADDPAAPTGEVNLDYFHQQLAPWGEWVTVGGVEYWRPAKQIEANPDWRPYYDNGSWVHTDNGLFWNSDYSWGDIPFHYGRWVRDPAMGWLWAPGYTWGPAWVFWRHAEADGSIGWAPLPVGAEFVNGAFVYQGAVVAADYDFGIHEECYTFVSYEHFHERFFRLHNHEYLYHVDHAHVHGFYQHSVVRNEFRRDEHGRFVNEGIGRDRVAHLTKVQHSGFEERRAVGDRQQLAKERENQARKAEAARSPERGSPASPTASKSHDAELAANKQSPSHTADARGKPSATPVSQVYRPPPTASKTSASSPPKSSTPSKTSSASSSGGGKSKK